jgi:hypothetical protein
MCGQKVTVVFGGPAQQTTVLTASVSQVTVTGVVWVATGLNARKTASISVAAKAFAPDQIVV